MQAIRIGYASQTQTVTVGTGLTVSVDFALSETAIVLDELVAVGYGTVRRGDVTGSVASVSPDRLERVPHTRLEQALQASVPGITVQTSTADAEPNFNLRIRGINSIRASNTPLIVVDGMPYNGPLSEINQRDIASMEILKDASAAAIYGARGSNGVILITTKRGDEGRPRFTYEAHVGSMRAANLPRLMTGPEQAAWRCEYLKQGQNCETELFTQTELEALRTGRFTDWYDLALRRGTEQEHNISVAGGFEGTRYYVGASYLDVQGVAKNDQFQRASLRVNVSQSFSDWLEIGTSNQFANIDRSGVPVSFQAAFQMSPLTIPFDENGNQMIFPWPEDPFFGNPLQGLLADDKDITRRLISSNYLEARLNSIEGLSYRMNAGFELASRDFSRYYGRNTKTGLEARGLAQIDNGSVSDWTVENILRFNRSFGAHNVDVTALYSMQNHREEQENIRAQGFPNDVLRHYQVNVAALVQPTTSFSEWKLTSQMGRINYGYDDRYLITVTARRDGYSGFGARNKYGIFPSVALGWNLSNESFWPVNTTVTYLRLRGSYGKNGNQAIAPYQTLARLQEWSYVFQGTTAPGFIPASLANPNLKWETTTSANLGVDFGLFDGRVTGGLDVYLSSTHDLLLNRLVSPVHGLTAITDNIGSVRNKGIELSFSSVNVERERFTWRMDFNISHNRNEITELYGTGQDDVANRWFIGKPINVNYDYFIDGIWQLDDDIASSWQPDAKPGDVKIRDLNGDGRITPDDRGFVGDQDPTYTAGLNNSFRYGNLSLDFFIQSVQGVQRRNDLFQTWPYEGRGNTLKLDYWTPQNPTNSMPANRFDSNPHGAGLYQDASFIRLKDVTLSYDVPGDWANRFGLQSFRIYLNAKNLWTSSEWTGLDPELGNQYNVPLEKVFTVGTTVSF